MLKQHLKIILASKSPRRQELLKGIGVQFDIETRDVLEDYGDEMNIYEVPVYLSKLKSGPFLTDKYKGLAVITSDTVVIIEGEILEKPKSEEDAVKMIRKLSGKTHEVVTGVSVLINGINNTFSNVTKVTFDEVSAVEAEYYVKSFKPLDKAGSYGIQEWIGYTKIAKIDGCYYNVMGLPLRDLYKKLIELNVIQCYDS
ncbi:MAG: septum formation protein [Glaciecola sp.]|jgi:septum formation protein